jgi:hypothetical protein
VGPQKNADRVGMAKIRRKNQLAPASKSIIALL